MPDRMVIIGAGECGVRCAFALREAGFDGEVTLVGDEQAVPYERPPLSKNHPLAERPIAAKQAFADAGITLIRGRHVSTIDRSGKGVRLRGGDTIAYDTVLIAAGARARAWPARRPERVAEIAAQGIVRPRAGRGRRCRSGERTSPAPALSTPAPGMIAKSGADLSAKIMRHQGSGAAIRFTEIGPRSVTGSRSPPAFAPGGPVGSPAIAHRMPASASSTEMPSRSSPSSR